jgi:DNA-binding NtrC family response regulator
MDEQQLMTGSVLCVDDDPDVGELLRGLLQSMGYQAEVTTSPLHACQRVVTGNYDVVISDLRMDEMHGLDLCQRIRESRPDMPVIVVTGQTGRQDTIAALRAGAYAFMTKPVDPELLELSLAAAVRAHRLQLHVARLESALAGTPAS